MTLGTAESHEKKRVSFASTSKLEETLTISARSDDMPILSPRNSNLQSSSIETESLPESLPQIRKDVDFVTKNAPDVKKRGPWSMGCFLDGLCVAPDENGAEVMMSPVHNTAQVVEDKENLEDTPAEQYSLSDSGSILDKGDGEDSGSVDEDAFLPPVDDGFVPQEGDVDAFLPPADDGAFVPPGDDAAFLPPVDQEALFIASVNDSEEAFFPQNESAFLPTDPNRPLILEEHEVVIDQGDDEIIFLEMELASTTEEEGRRDSPRKRSFVCGAAAPLCLGETTCENKAEAGNKAEAAPVAAEQDASHANGVELSSSTVSDNADVELNRNASQLSLAEEEIQELKVQLAQSKEEKEKAISEAVKQVETKLRTESRSEVIKAAQSAKIAHSVKLNSAVKAHSQREQKLQEEKREQVLKIAGAMKVATVVKNEFVAEENFGELKTLKQSLGNLLKNQKVTIETLRLEGEEKDQEIESLQNNYKITSGLLSKSQVSLKAADSTLITMKGELSQTRAKLRKAEDELSQTKQLNVSLQSSVAILSVAQQERDSLRTTNETLAQDKAKSDEMKNELELLVKTLQQENKEMRQRNNLHSEEIQERENAIRDLKESFALLQQEASSAKNLLAENLTMKNRMEQLDSCIEAMKADIVGLLESVKSAENQKVEIEAAEQQIQHLNEQVRDLSQDCNSLRTALSSKSRGSYSDGDCDGCRDSSDGAEEQANRSSDGEHQKEAVKSDDCSQQREGKSQVGPKSKKHAGSEVDPVPSSSEDAFSTGTSCELQTSSRKANGTAPMEPTRDEVDPIFSIASNDCTEDESDQLGTDKMKMTIGCDAAPEQQTTQKSFKKLACACYAPSHSFVSIPEKEEAGMTMSNSTEEDIENGVGMDSKDSLASEPIAEVMLEGDNEDDLNQIEAVLNSFSNIDSAVSCDSEQTSTSMANNEQIEPAEIMAKVGEGEKSQLPLDSSNCVDGNATPPLAEDPLANKLESVSGQLVSVLGDSTQQFSDKKVGMLKVALKKLELEKEMILKEAEEEKSKAIAEMRAKLEEEKQAFVAAQEKRFEDEVVTAATSMLEEDEAYVASLVEKKKQGLEHLQQEMASVKEKPQLDGSNQSAIAGPMASSMADPQRMEKVQMAPSSLSSSMDTDPDASQTFQSADDGSSFSSQTMEQAGDLNAEQGSIKGAGLDRGETGAFEAQSKDKTSASGLAHERNEIDVQFRQEPPNESDSNLAIPAEPSLEESNVASGDGIDLDEQIKPSTQKKALPKTSLLIDTGYADTSQDPTLKLAKSTKATAAKQKPSLRVSTGSAKRAPTAPPQKAKRPASTRSAPVAASPRVPIYLRSSQQPKPKKPDSGRAMSQSRNPVNNAKSATRKSSLKPPTPTSFKPPTPASTRLGAKAPTPTSRLGAPTSKRTQIKKLNAPASRLNKTATPAAKRTNQARVIPQSRVPRPAQGASRVSKLNQPQTRLPTPTRNRQAQQAENPRNKRLGTSANGKSRVVSKPNASANKKPETKGGQTPHDSATKKALAATATGVKTAARLDKAAPSTVTTSSLEDSFASLMRTRDTFSPSKKLVNELKVDASSVGPTPVVDPADKNEERTKTLDGVGVATSADVGAEDTKSIVADEQLEAANENSIEPTQKEESTKPADPAGEEAGATLGPDSPLPAAEKSPANEKECHPSVSDPAGDEEQDKTVVTVAEKHVSNPAVDASEKEIGQALIGDDKEEATTSRLVADEDNLPAVEQPANNASGDFVITHEDGKSAVPASLPAILETATDGMVEVIAEQPGSCDNNNNDCQTTEVVVFEESALALERLRSVGDVSYAAVRNSCSISDIDLLADDDYKGGSAQQLAKSINPELQLLSAEVSSSASSEIENESDADESPETGTISDLGSDRSSEVVPSGSGGSAKPPEEEGGSLPGLKWSFR